MFCMSLDWNKLNRNGKKNSFKLTDGKLFQFSKSIADILSNVPKYEKGI